MHHGKVLVQPFSTLTPDGGGHGEDVGSLRSIVGTEGVFNVGSDVVAFGGDLVVEALGLAVVDSAPLCDGNSRRPEGESVGGEVVEVLDVP